MKRYFKKTLARLSVILYVILLITATVNAQNKSDIFVFKHRYNREGVQFIEQNRKLQEIKLLGGYMISPDKNGEINKASVKKYLGQLFKNVNDSGILCVNYEDRYYKDLRNYSKSHKRFLKAEKELVSLLQFIKNYRPNVKIGLYGIPFRTFYSTQHKWNNEQKFDKLLTNTDVIFPSLYILYKDEEIGSKRNDKYMLDNLDMAFEYGNRLNKPIMPFIWYAVNPGNKKYGSEILDKSFFQRYIKFIENYRSKNKNGVSGIVWWEPSEAAFEKIKRRNKNRFSSSSQLLIDYFNLIQ